ncbi:N-acetyl-gamma-glutamyl-phosphate reductase [Paenibacillus campi]|uniref:N-acetyl-gamma-glutamyl-phosphate reductase n=1 Tax=Paenibacillus campi TaxID=3106031 RepID=UPI002AFDFB8D|nr:N-acetyl-gamma-glutamyl-phosphate reductase [Paenibacillus sp. SGZ-1009]
MNVAVIGASGYIGGELLRLLLTHPYVNVIAATSNRFKGEQLSTIHPNLRGYTELKFSDHQQVPNCDVLFLCLPHGISMQHIDEYSQKAHYIIDLSSDFRLKNRNDYAKWYKKDHMKPEWTEQFVSGIPEFYRASIQQARYIAVPGCMANASLLALLPLHKEGVLSAHKVIVDAKTGSSGSGASPNLSNLHAQRSGVMRIFKPLGHRHEAELQQEIDRQFQFSVTSVELVRGIQVIAHVTFNECYQDKDLWKMYRKYYEHEPFVRVIKQKKGLYRYPEPKILAGTNYCDIGFALSDDGQSAVIISAIDNLVKGGAGNAVQSLNIIGGWEEKAGLNFMGLHPI